MKQINTFTALVLWLFIVSLGKFFMYTVFLKIAVWGCLIIYEWEAPTSLLFMLASFMTLSDMFRKVVVLISND